MATAIQTSFWPITDSNGDPVSGAKIYVYNVGTTTARDIFSDTGLSVAVSNPIICNSAGRTTTDGGTTVGMVYTGTGSYKIVVKTSADATLYTLDNIDGGVPVGSGALAIANGGTAATSAATALTNLGGASADDLADLATDVAALVGASASTEKTHLATGTTAQRPTAPVDGDVRRNTTIPQWEVYNGASWDKLAVAADVTTEINAGDATATALIAMRKLSAQSISGASSVLFESLISSTYRNYIIDFYDVVAASGTPNLIMQAGTGGTPTYDTGSNYHYTYAAFGGGSVSNANSAGTTSFLITPLAATTGQGASGRIQFFDANSAAHYKPVNYHSHNATTGIIGSGRYLSITAVTALRLLTSSGNLSGTFVLYGLL